MLKIVVLLSILTSGISARGSFPSIVEWKQLDFIFPNGSERERAINEKRFVATECVPLDVDVQYRGFFKQPRIFITTPRFSEGVPITLGTVSNYHTFNGPLIDPYPDYSWHVSGGKDCNTITSVYRMMIDPCQRLWILDTGRIGGEKVCKPKLLSFDLRTDKLIMRYEFPNEVLSGDSILVTPVVDTDSICRSTKVYIADISVFSLLVFDAEKKSTWKIKNPLFRFDPNFKKFTVNGESFEFDDGILGMAFPQKTDSKRDDRLLYFHSMAADTENSVPISVLNDEAAFRKNESAHSGSFRKIGNRGTQSVAQAMDSFKNLYFGMVGTNEIGSWNSETPYNTENIKIIARDPNTIQFPSGMKVIKTTSGNEELWVTTNRLQKFLSDTYNWNEVNFRIMAKSIPRILRDQAEFKNKNQTNREGFSLKSNFEYHKNFLN